MQNWSLRSLVVFQLVIDFELKHVENILRNLSIRPKLGRSCRCICMLGHDYESVVKSVSLKKDVPNNEYSNDNPIIQ